MNNHFYIVILSLCILSCTKETPTEPPLDPLEKWHFFHIHNYTIDQTRTCYCINGGMKVRLTVRSDTIYSAVHVFDGSTLSYSETQSYCAVEKLFSIIHTVSDSMVIRYNEQYGYPEYLDIDPAGHPRDAGVLYETTYLQIQYKSVPLPNQRIKLTA